MKHTDINTGESYAGLTDVVRETIKRYCIAHPDNSREATHAYELMRHCDALDRAEEHFNKKLEGLTE